MSTLLSLLPPGARAAIEAFGPGRALTLALVFLGVVGTVIGTAYWASRPTWTLLATDMDPESMAGVVDRLKTAKVQYVLDEGGRRVRVPQDRVDELRLQLAAEGLPASGRIGFELFDRMMFGATELTERVNFQRALEGELSRTIATLANVASARVHLVLPRESLFAGSQEAAKASVVLRLRSALAIGAGDVQGIVSLVASSVTGLAPSSVVVLDSTGRQLSSSADRSGSLQHLERQQQVERDLAARLVALLEPVVGPGRVRTTVTATLQSDSENELEERWDPTTVVRSRQMSSEATGRSLASGIAGARSNLPPDADTEPSAPPPVPLTNNNRTTEATNYEVSKFTRQRVSPAGQLSRLSVAVLVDHVPVTTTNDDGTTSVTQTPRTPEDLARFQQLVASAIGFDAARGDQVTVENIAFDHDPLREAPDAGPVVAPPVSVRDLVKQYWYVGAGVLVVLLLVMGITWRAARPRAIRGPVVGRAVAAAIAAGATPAELTEAMASPEGRASLAAQHVARLAQREPEQLARVVRGWLAEDEAET